MKKFFVIIVLFALPLVAYLFFASGVNNFARLPVLTNDLYSLEEFQHLEGEPVSFEGHISILSFPGEEPMDYLTRAYHLTEKIYKPYHEFYDFQFISVVPEGSETEIARLKKELSEITDLKKWKFVTGSPDQVKELFQSLGTDMELGQDLSSPNAFIIDKNARLRGRENNDDGEELFGYDAGSLAVLNNEMNDDVKVILAEYRLELKKYKKNPNQEK